MKKKKTKNLKPLLIALGIILAILLIFNKIYRNTVNIPTFYNGITIGGEDVSGMTEAQAISMLEVKNSETFENKKLILQSDESQVELTPKHFNFQPAVEEAVEKAYRLGRDGSPVKRFNEIMSLKKGYDVPLRYTYDEDKVVQAVKEVIAVLNKEPIKGSVELKGGRVIITKSEIGYALDQKALNEDIIQYLHKDIFDSRDIIKKKILAPKDYITSEADLEGAEGDFSRINGVIADFSTSFAGSSEGRIYNIKKATEPFSELMLKPGEEISFNQETGLKNLENGYKKAPMVVNGEFVDGVGGGVCQVSTTLYNALLRCGMEITERHNHSAPVEYADLGFDAAVADGALDFKFRNNFDYPIFINGMVSGDTLRFYIYGDVSEIKNYEFQTVEESRTEPEVEEIFDSSLPENSKVKFKEGRPGIVVSTYRYDDKGNKEFLGKSSYKKVNYVFKVGRSTGTVNYMPKNENIEKNDAAKENVTQNNMVNKNEENSEDEGTEIPFADPNNPNNNVIQ